MKRLLILFGIQNTLRNKEDCLEIAFNNSNNVNKPVLIKIEISNAIYFKMNKKEYSTFYKETEVLLCDGMEYKLISVNEEKSRKGIYTLINL